MRRLGTLTSEVLVLALSTLLLFPAQVFAAPPTPEAGSTTTVATAGNGVPVVNIAAPSASGLSHNKFTAYNVDSQGLVLNNGDKSQQYRLSQLAGQVAANPNLASGVQAGIILNEVTGGSRSSLLGFTEVLGGKADVIVANPFGITCNGCGFINTDKVSLVTGTPNVTGGVLNHFVVNSGDILITGKGLNASGQELLNLVSRQITIDGQVNAKKLNVVGGAARWNHATGESTDLEGEEWPVDAPPTYAIDSTALGGMYAGRITLKNTGDGAGVRIMGEAAATADDFVINAYGRIELTGAKVSAARDVSIQQPDWAGEIALSRSSLTAGRDINISHQRDTDGAGASWGTVTMEGGSLKAGRDLSVLTGGFTDTGVDSPASTDENKRAAGGNISVESDVFQLGLSKVFYSALGSLGLNSMRSSVGVADSQFSSGASLTLRAGSGDLTPTNVLMQSGTGTMSLETADGRLTLDGLSKFKSTAGNISLTSTDEMRVESDVSAASGTLAISAVGRFTISSASTAKDMTIGRNANYYWAMFDVDLGERLLTTGRLTASGINNFFARKTEVGSFDITAAYSIIAERLFAKSTTVGSIFRGTGTVLVDNAGLLHSNYDLTIGGRAIVTENAALSALRDLTIGGGVGNQGLLYAGRDLTVNSIYGEGYTNVYNSARDAYTVDLGMGMTEDISGFTGTIQAGRDMVLNAGEGEFLNNSIINAGRNLTISAKTFNNTVPGGTTTTTWGSPVNSKTTSVEGAPWLASDLHWYKDIDFTQTWDRTYGYSTTASVKPQIVADSGTLTIKDFATAVNNSGSIVAPTVAITSSRSGASFANSVITSTLNHYVKTWKVQCRYNFFGVYLDEVAYGESTSYTSQTTDSTTAGIRANTLTATGFALSNLGSPLPSSLPAPATPTATSIPGLVVSLPAGPNGLYVTSKDPNSKYLVESNPLYTNLDNFLGSEYLAKKYNVNPDTTIKRLGDAAYETYLVQQQLMAQIGATKTNLAQTDKQQMQSLMDSAAKQAKDMGLVYGQALTATQQAGLKEDMVWMVETTVGGQKVLAPVVYLSATTRQMFQPGATIDASVVKMDLTSLENVGGTIKGAKLDIKAQGDIENVSGTIQGIDVSLKSTGGSIVNKTFTQTTGNEQADNVQTTVGKTGSITASADLKLDAKKDIVNQGAEMFAGSTAALKAGGDVVFDTVQDKEAKRTPGDKVGREASATQVGSKLTGLMGVSISAGKDVTLAGTDVSTYQGLGDINVKAGGDVNILARDNTSSSTKTTVEKGFGVGGGLYGTQVTTTETTETKSVGSKLSAGNVNISSGKTVTVQGSDINAIRDTTIEAEDLKVLAGRDSKSTTTKVETQTYLSLTAATGGDLKMNGEAKADAEARAGLSGAGGAGAGASASASGSASKDAVTGESESSAEAKTKQQASTGLKVGAGASASGDITATLDMGGFDMSKRITTTTTETTTTAKGSTLTSGGNLVLKAKKTATLEGAKLDAGKDIDITAADVKITDVHDTYSKSTTTQEDRAGLYFSTETGAKGGAELDARANVANPSSGVSGKAEINAEVFTKNNIDLGRGSSTWTDESATTSKGSSVAAGGNLRINSANKLSVQGSELSGEKGVDLKAKDMNFLAGQDTKSSSSTTSTFAFGGYLDGGFGGKAGATGEAKAGLGVGADAGAEAKVEAGGGAGIQGRYSLDTEKSGGTTAKASTIRSGSGSITRTAQNSITDVGTNVDAAGDFTQSATTWTSKAAQDTSYSSSSSLNNAAKIGAAVRAEAGASAGAGGTAGLGLTGHAEADADAKVGAGIEAAYSGSLSTKDASSTTAQVSNIKAGGKVSSTTSGKTSLEGTQITSAGDTTIEAASLDYTAARNTSSSKTMDGSVDASARGLVNFGVGTTVDVDLSGSVKGSGATRDESTAVAGGIASGGKITLKTTQGDMRLVGTNLQSEGDTTVSSKGDMSYEAARDTVKTSSTNFDASAGLTTTKGKGTGGVGVNAEGGFSISSSDESTAKAGSVQSGGNLVLSSGKSASLEGTRLEATGDASLSAAEGVTISAARSTKSEESYGGRVKAGMGYEKEDQTNTGKLNASVEGSYKKSSESTAEAGGIKAGNTLSITSGKDVTLEGTELEAGNKAGIKAGGSVNFKAAEDTKESFGVGARLSGETEVATTRGGDGATGGKTSGAGAGNTGKTGTSGSTAKTGGATGGTGGGTGGNDDGTTTDSKGGVGLDVNYSKSNTQRGGSLKAGAGGIEIEAKAGDVNLVGTGIETTGDGSIKAGRNVSITEAVSTESNVGVNIDLSGGLKTKTPKKTTPGTDQKPATPPPPGTGAGTGTDKKNLGTGGTQGSDGSKKGDADLKTWQTKQRSVLDELKKRNPRPGSTTGGGTGGSGATPPQPPKSPPSGGAGSGGSNSATKPGATGSGATTGGGSTGTGGAGGTAGQTPKKNNILDNMGGISGTLQVDTDTNTEKSGATIKTGGKLNITSGGKTTQSGSTIEAGGGKTINENTAPPQ